MKSSGRGTGRGGESGRAARRADRSVLVPLALVAVALVAVAACATGRNVSPFQETGTGSITVEVRNEGGNTGGSIQVFISPTGGSAELLGTVVGRGPRTFTFQVTRPRAEHRLLARSSEGRRTTSRTFVPQGSEGVLWEVESNHLIRR